MMPHAHDPENRTRPLVAIAMGDPAGVGPEIILKALWRKDLFARCRPMVIGDSRILERASFWLGCDPLTFEQVVDPSDADYLHGSVPIYDLRSTLPSECPVGEIGAVGGKAAVEALYKGSDLAAGGRVDALVAAPVSREALIEAGFTHTGQSPEGLLAQRAGVEKIGALRTGGSLRVVQVSGKAALHEALRSVTRARIEAAIELAHRSARALGIAHPRIGVASLNPSAGDDGLPGEEERKEILPAVQATRGRGWEVADPLPAARLFARAARGEFDIVVVMYPDQANLPLALLAPDECVHALIGMPFACTLVDHSPAYDIAGTGKASEKGLLAAVDLAIQMVKASV